jgi:RND family efflux transporter MFP subunit
MRVHSITSGLLAIAAGLSLLSACSGEETAIIEERIRPVRTALAINAPEVIKYRFAGRSQAASTTNISFRISGTIAEFPAQVGKALKKGDVIARLDSTDYGIKLEYEKAVLGKVTTNARNAKSRYDRIEKLFADHVVSEMDYETAKTEYQIGEAEVRQAQRNVELGRENITYHELRIPADQCTVTEAAASVNENISAGQTIAILSCGSIIEVVSIVPESAVDLASIGLQVEAEFNAIKGQSFSAEVTEIGISSSVNSVYLVTARLKDSDPQLRPGMAAELMLGGQFDVSADHVWVPMVAVGEEDKQRFVMIYQPLDDLTGTVKRINVETGQLALDLIEITAGLQEGQHVITAGLSQIQDGLTVKLLKKDL